MQWLTCWAWAASRLWSQESTNRSTRKPWWHTKARRAFITVSYARTSNCPPSSSRNREATHSDLHEILSPNSTTVRHQMQRGSQADKINRQRMRTESWPKTKGMSCKRQSMKTNEKASTRESSLTLTTHTISNSSKKSGRLIDSWTKNWWQRSVTIHTKLV